MYNFNHYDTSYYIFFSQFLNITNAWLPSVMLALMPSGGHACLWGGEHVCVQSVLYKHVRSIDEPLWSNASLRHTLVTIVLISIVTLVLIVNTLSTYYFSLIPLLFFTAHSLLHFKLVFGYGPEVWTGIPNLLHCYFVFFPWNFSSYLLITMATVSERGYVRVLCDLECLTTNFMALEQENQKILQDLQ